MNTFRKTRHSGFFFSHLHNIRRIRKYLLQESARALVHALIMGGINYYNSLLFGLPSVHLLKLQRLQNAAARLLSRYSYIATALFSLHWLPVIFRIDFKILLPTFKGMVTHLVTWLIWLMLKNSRAIILSASGLILKYPSLKMKNTLGDRAFSSATPNLWKSLSLHM